MRKMHRVSRTTARSDAILILLIISKQSKASLPLSRTVVAKCSAPVIRFSRLHFNIAFLGNHHFQFSSAFMAKVRVDFLTLTNSRAPHPRLTLTLTLTIDTQCSFFVHGNTGPVARWLAPAGDPVKVHYRGL